MLFSGVIYNFWEFVYFERKLWGTKYFERDNHKTKENKKGYKNYGKYLKLLRGILNQIQCRRNLANFLVLFKIDDI